MYLYSVHCINYFQMMTKVHIRDVLKEAQVGFPSPSPMLLDLDAKLSVSLLSMAKTDRYLVVNFGSCT